jgi:hypothetical protein
MTSVKDILANKSYNVNVDKYINNNVYVDVSDIEKINESNDKHKATGELVAEKLRRPDNIKLYIKLSYLNSPSLLLEWVAIALEAFRDGKTTNLGGYFYGIVRNLGKVR